MWTFLLGSRHRVQSRSISHMWFQGLEFHSSESLLESKCPASDISQPLLLLSVAIWLVPDNEMWKKWCGSPLNQVNVLSLCFIFFLLLGTEDLEHCEIIVSKDGRDIIPWHQQKEECCPLIRSTVWLFYMSANKPHCVESLNFCSLYAGSTVSDKLLSRHWHYPTYVSLEQTIFSQSY